MHHEPTLEESNFPANLKMMSFSKSNVPGQK